MTVAAPTRRAPVPARAVRLARLLTGRGAAVTVVGSTAALMAGADVVPHDLDVTVRHRDLPALLVLE